MKSINQIFKTNKELLDLPEIKELVNYCLDLEEELIDVKSSSTKSKEQVYLDIIRDIYSSCCSTLNSDEEALRFTEAEQINFKQSIINLKKYILLSSIDNRFNL
jgi:hypothetical protein